MNTEAPAAAARPDLSRLPYETHLNVLCAETQGARWRLTKRSSGDPGVWSLCWPYGVLAVDTYSRTGW